jgi:hypothetical protein
VCGAQSYNTSAATLLSTSQPGHAHTPPLTGEHQGSVSCGVMAMITWCGKRWTGCLRGGDNSTAFAARVQTPHSNVRQHLIVTVCWAACPAGLRAAGDVARPQQSSSNTGPGTMQRKVSVAHAFSMTGGSGSKAKRQHAPRVCLCCTCRSKGGLALPAHCTSWTVSFPALIHAEGVCHSPQLVHKQKTES